MVCECVVLRNQERGVDCDFISWIVTLLWRDTHGFHNVIIQGGLRVYAGSSLEQ